MSAVTWVALATGVASIALALAAALAGEVLSKDLQRAPHKTVWGLVALLLSREMAHVRGSEHQSERDNGD
jgi:hypothetical protein